MGAGQIWKTVAMEIQPKQSITSAQITYSTTKGQTNIQMVRIIVWKLVTGLNLLIIVIECLHKWILENY